jgi:DNA primase
MCNTYVRFTVYYYHMSSGDAVQQIKDRLNIVDVISPYVELHKAGRHFKGKSPFTSEKTPSFYVSPERGMYYCFSTSQGGDMFTFVQTMEGVDFKEALKMLAVKAGIELVPENPEKRSEREQMYQLLQTATDFFVERLQDNPDALAYLEKRQVAVETIRKWRIGYAPGPPQHGWRELRQYLKQKGFTDIIMQKAGLIKTAGSAKEPFDVFRDRVMFPLKDQNGKVVAFSGRLLTKDSEAPKYVNSPETDLYHKSDMLYGYDVAKHSIRQLGFWLVVEGQFDVVMSHQVGYTNAVAVSGTAMTLHHVQLLERLSNKVVLALDADKAGIAAMKRAATLMLKRGMDVKVAVMPEGADPADLAANSPKDLKRAVGQAVSIVEFLLHQILSAVSDVRMRKLQVRDEIVPFLALIESRIDQEHFEGLVADALDASREAIHSEVVREIERHQSTVESRATVMMVETETKNTQSKRSNQLRQYLNILMTLVSSEEKLFLERAIADLEQKMLIEQFAGTSVPDPGMYFTAERDIERLTPVARREEVVHTINTWRQLTLREALRDVREQLGEQGESEDLLAKLHLYQSLLTNNPYTADDI